MLFFVNHIQEEASLVGVSMRLFSISTNTVTDNRNLQMTQIYHSDKVRRTEQLHKQILNRLFS